MQKTSPKIGGVFLIAGKDKYICNKEQACYNIRVSKNVNIEC